MLGVVFVSRAQARGLQSPFQDQLSPCTLGFTRPPQCDGQIVGLVANFDVRLEELIDVGAQLLAAPHLFHARGFDPGLEILQPGLEGLENLVQAGLVLLRETL